MKITKSFKELFNIARGLENSCCDESLDTKCCGANEISNEKEAIKETTAKCCDKI